MSIFSRVVEKSTDLQPLWNKISELNSVIEGQKVRIDKLEDLLTSLRARFNRSKYLSENGEPEEPKPLNTSPFMGIHV